MAREKAFYIYTGISRNSDFNYIKITNLEVNDGSNIDTTHFKEYCYKKAIFSSKRIGGIFEIEVDPEKGDIYYKTSALPVAYWKNEGNLAAWKLANRVADTYRKMLAKGATNQFVDLLEPIRRAYYNASYNEKTLILAEVVRAITDGF